MEMIAENEGVQTDPGVCRCVFFSSIFFSLLPSLCSLFFFSIYWPNGDRCFRLSLNLLEAIYEKRSHTSKQLRDYIAQLNRLRLCLLFPVRAFCTAAASLYRAVRCKGANKNIESWLEYHFLVFLCMIQYMKYPALSQKIWSQTSSLQWGSIGKLGSILAWQEDLTVLRLLWSELSAKDGV